MKKHLSLLACLLLISAFTFAQQLPIPPPSPTQKIEQRWATTKITIEYSRPSIKGRTIFGDLVPWGEVWRTGANAATKVMFGEDVQVQGTNVPAGKYALYTIPDKTEWTVILHKDTANWGSFDYKPEHDVVRFKVKPVALPTSVETFTININNLKPTSCDIELMWEKTMISFNIKTEIDQKIMAAIDESMKGEKPPYWQAANYYFENGKDLNKAYEWVNKALETRPDAYWMLTAKAKMEMKMGKYQDAVVSAEKAKELAIADKDNSYIQQNEKIIAEAKAKL